MKKIARYLVTALLSMFSYASMSQSLSGQEIDDSKILPKEKNFAVQGGPDVNLHFWIAEFVIPIESDGFYVAATALGTYPIYTPADLSYTDINTYGVSIAWGIPSKWKKLICKGLPWSNFCTSGAGGVGSIGTTQRSYGVFTYQLGWYVNISYRIIKTKSFSLCNYAKFINSSLITGQAKTGVKLGQDQVWFSQTHFGVTTLFTF